MADLGGRRGRRYPLDLPMPCGQTAARRPAAQKLCPCSEHWSQVRLVHIFNQLFVSIETPVDFTIHESDEVIRGIE